MGNLLNVNALRLIVSVVAAWLVSAAAGLAALPAHWGTIALPVAFVVFVGVALWNAGRPRPGRWRDGPTPPVESADIVAVMRRYRLRWLAPLTLIVVVLISLNALGVSRMALALTGSPVSANVVAAHEGECTLARPDGTPIPGSLVVPSGRCPDPVDVLIDPVGLIDPVLADEASLPRAVAAMVLLATALLLCLPAARPRES